MKTIIALTGPESSGKTTLGRMLAEKLRGAILVEEAAREYLRIRPSAYSLEDVLRIADLQHEAIRSAIESPAPCIILDTEYLVLRIWLEEMFSHRSAGLDRLWEAFSPSLMLLCRPDLPWEPDPLRSNPHDRDRLYEKYRTELDQSGKPYAIMEGLGKQRADLALQCALAYTSRDSSRP